MGYILFILFVFLVFSILFSLIRKGKAGRQAKMFRIFSVVLGISIFGYWFAEGSLERFEKNALSVQVINSLPQPLDFYIIKIEKQNLDMAKVTKHLGHIRPEFYRIEYLQMNNSDEYWVVGYLGKKNLVYFSQQYVPNKNIDQIVEAKNYLIQSEKLASEAKKEIERYSSHITDLGIWTTLDLLLLFLNLVLILRKK